MLTHIYTLINEDEELMELYQTDSTFKKSIDLGYQLNLNTDQILMFALKNGYKSKQNAIKNVINSYIEYIQDDCIPTFIDREKLQ